MDLIPSSRFYAIGLMILHEDLLHLLAVFDLNPLLHAGICHRTCHLMREAPCHIAATAHIVAHQECIDREWKRVHRLTDIDPVGTENLLHLFRQMRGLINDFFCGIACSLHKFLMLPQHLQLAEGVFIQIDYRLIHLLAEIQQCIDFFSGAWILLVNLICRNPGSIRVLSGMKFNIDLIFFRDERIGFRYPQPVNHDAHLFKILPHE